MDLSSSDTSADGPVASLLRNRAVSTIHGMDVGHYRFGQIGSVPSLIRGFNQGRQLPALPNLSLGGQPRGRSGQARQNDDGDEDDDDDDDDDDDGADCDYDDDYEADDG